jgi:Lipocalin-like domain
VGSERRDERRLGCEADPKPTLADLFKPAAIAATPRAKDRFVANGWRYRTLFDSACRLLVYSSALLFFAGMQAPRAAEIDQNPLIGTWLLVKYVDTPENSEPIFAFGKKPVGHFIFTAGGHVAFSIMRNPPGTETRTSDPDPDACIPGWYCAYYGTYTVDVKHGVGVTHVLSANIPGFLNTDQPRHFKIDGNRLVVAETYLSGGTRIKAERIFVREALPSPRP